MGHTFARFSDRTSFQKDALPEKEVQMICRLQQILDHLFPSEY